MNVKLFVNYALKTVGPPVKQVYKRTTTTTGGNSLLGIYPADSIQPVDVLLSPQPAYEQLQDRASVLSTSGLVLEATDYEIILSADSISINELEAGNLTFVFKNAKDNVTEEYRVLGYNPPEFQGSYVAFFVYARRKTTT